uniref:Uncharacterized protein n=1 Tax=Rhizophora mucronata TaxID=61149 RepID=A0A2P2J259_RHIMU
MSLGYTLKSIRCRTSCPGYVQSPKYVSTPESVPCQIRTKGKVKTLKA